MPLRPAAAAAVALSLALPAVASAEGGRLQPGLWEITAQVEVPGMAGSIPPVSQTECLSQADLDADPAAGIDKGACRATDVQRSGDRVTWNLACGGSQAGTGRGEIVYEGTTGYGGWMTFETGGTTLRTNLRARRIGECKPRG
jgi:hypothetical protein